MLNKFGHLFTVTFKCGTLNHAYAAYSKMFVNSVTRAGIFGVCISTDLLPDVSVNVDVQAKYSLHCCFPVERKPPSQKVVFNCCFLL